MIKTNAPGFVPQRARRNGAGPTVAAEVAAVMVVVAVRNITMVTVMTVVVAVRIVTVTVMTIVVVFKIVTASTATIVVAMGMIITVVTVMTVVVAVATMIDRRRRHDRHRNGHPATSRAGDRIGESLVFGR